MIIYKRWGVRGKEVAGKKATKGGKGRRSNGGLDAGLSALRSKLCVSTVDHSNSHSPCDAVNGRRRRFEATAGSRTRRRFMVRGQKDGGQREK